MQIAFFLCCCRYRSCYFHDGQFLFVDEHALYNLSVVIAKPFSPWKWYFKQELLATTKESLQKIGKKHSASRCEMIFQKLGNWCLPLSWIYAKLQNVLFCLQERNCKSAVLFFSYLHTMQTGWSKQCYYRRPVYWLRHFGHLFHNSAKIHCNGMHGRNWVGDREDASPTFSDSVDIICHVPPHFSLYVS